MSNILNKYFINVGKQLAKSENYDFKNDASMVVKVFRLIICFVQTLRMLMLLTQ